MKIVIQNTSRVWGGNEKWLATLAGGLVARGHRVIVSCRRAGPVREELERRGIPTTGVRPGTYADLPRGMRFLAWLRRERPDALLLTSWKGIPWGSWAARRAGVPRVVVRLGIVRTLPKSGRHTWPFRRRVDALIVNSAEIRDEWLRSAPWFPADAVHVVLNGIVSPTALSPDERAAVRAELGVPADARLIAGVGHMHKRKGFDLLLDAFARAAVDGSHVVIVGTGPEEEALRRRSIALGVADRVRWAGFRPDVPRVLGGCDLFVLGSRNEGMANVMLEAMAAGTPAVATDISGVRAAIGPRDGRSAAGWIVPADDPDAMADAIRIALSDTDEARRRADEASWRIASWFSVERMVAEAEAVLAGGRSPNAG